VAYFPLSFSFSDAHLLLKPLKGMASIDYGKNICPGFSWDRVNFHKKLVGLLKTANQMGYSIPCDVMLSI